MEKGLKNEKGGKSKEKNEKTNGKTFFTRKNEKGGREVDKKGGREGENSGRKRGHFLEKV